MPLGVVRTKSRSIWDDINPFIEKLVANYKQSQQTKADNELTLSWVNDLEKAMKPQEVKSLLEIQEQFTKNLDIEGFEKEFATPAMNLLQQKEMQMNPQDFAGISPEQQVVPEGQTETKLMPDVKEWGILYKFVSELPTGGLSTEDFKPTLDIFKKQLESGRAMGSAAQQFLSMIMGQSMPIDQRQKVEQDVGFTKELQSVLFPKEKAPSSDYERWLQDKPSFEEFKAIGKDPKKEIDLEALNKFLVENNMKIKGVNVNPSTGNLSYSFGAEEEKVPIEDTIAKAEEWVKNHPGTRIDDINFKTGSVSIGQKPKTPQGGTKKLVPTYQTIQTINRDLYANPEERERILADYDVKYSREGVTFASEADVAKNIYNMFEGIMFENEWIDEEGKVLEEEAYRDYYVDYEKYAKQYFDLTGQILPKKYLSIEEAGVYEKKQWKWGVAQGDQKPILNTENIPWSWQTGIDPTQAIYLQMQRENIQRTKEGKKPLTLQDLDLEALAKEGVDIDRLKKIFGF